MPYSESIADRLNEAIPDDLEYKTKKMLGGICHLIKGNMFFGVYRSTPLPPSIFQ